MQPIRYVLSCTTHGYGTTVSIINNNFPTKCPKCGRPKGKNRDSECNFSFTKSLTEKDRDSFTRKTHLKKGETMSIKKVEIKVPTDYYCKDCNNEGILKPKDEKICTQCESTNIIAKPAKSH